jgi:uncharacterized protein YdiU (UPF0061 family)
MGRALAAKLGLAALDRDGDDALLAGLFDVLQATETDMTIFYRLLAAVPLDDASGDEALIQPLRPAFYNEAEAFAAAHRTRLVGWLRRYAARVRADNAPAGQRRRRMNAANPRYVLRNYLAQQAIDALADGDVSVMERLMAVLQRPYDEQPANDDLAERRPEWARHKAGCSALSCSS